LSLAWPGEDGFITKGTKEFTKDTTGARVDSGAVFFQDKARLRRVGLIEASASIQNPSPCVEARGLTAAEPLCGLREFLRALRDEPSGRQGAGGVLSRLFAASRLGRDDKARPCQMGVGP
jgi:hypothetical protein